MLEATASAAEAKKKTGTMEDLSLHILDVVENGTAASASLIEIDVAEDPAAARTVIRIKDDGRGMDPEMAAAATHPFVTTRSTRRVGLGLPLLQMAAEETGGSLTIDSSPGAGTEVTAVFRTDHIDCKPLGDLAGTMVTLILGHPQVDFVFHHDRGGETTELDTRELKQQLGEVPITAPAVLNLIRDHIGGPGDAREGEDHG
jgi:hypothetical protein